MNQQIKIAQIIQLVLILGFCVANYVLGDFSNIEKVKWDSSNLMFVLLPIAAYFFGLFISKNALSKVRKEQPTSEKIIAYQSSLIMRWATLEGAGFLILILKPELIIINIAILFLLIIIRPSKENAKAVLNIKESDFNS